MHTILFVRDCRWIIVMIENKKRLHRCCFTGHRPEKLSLPESEVKAELEKEIRLAIADGINVFITGMAPGVDIWAAEVVLELKEELPLKLIAASPHPGFENRWPISWQKRYAAIMAKADFIKEVCSHYSRGCYQIRNEWMVDHSARVIAVWNGSPSGTKNTIMYANRKSVPVINVLDK